MVLKSNYFIIELKSDNSTLTAAIQLFHSTTPKKKPNQSMYNQFRVYSFRFIDALSTGWLDNITNSLIELSLQLIRIGKWIFKTMRTFQYGTSRYKNKINLVHLVIYYSFSGNFLNKIPKFILRLVFVVSH